MEVARMKAMKAAKVELMSSVIAHQFMTDEKMGQDEEGIFYGHTHIVTFGDTNAEGVVGHEKYPFFFGVVRELFGLRCIPKFAEEAGRVYLLKTRRASYEYFRDFCFGDEILIKMRIIGISSASFTLEAKFVDARTSNLHTIGEQQIVYADLKGKPRRLPGELRQLLESIQSIHSN